MPCCSDALSRCCCIVCKCFVCSLVVCSFVSASVSPPIFRIVFFGFGTVMFSIFFWYVYVWYVCVGWGGCAMCVVLTCACDIAQRSRVCARESLGAPHVLMLDWLAALCTRRHFGACAACPRQYVDKQYVDKQIHKRTARTLMHKTCRRIAQRIHARSHTHTH